MTIHTRHFGFSLLLGMALVVGCESEKGPSMRDRQNAAMNDPFNYNPDSELMSPKQDDKVDPTDISGGGTSEFKKDSFKRDWDSFWNP